MKYIRTATEILVKSSKLDDTLDIRDSFSKYERLIFDDGWATIHLLDKNIPTKRELESNLELLYNNIILNDGSISYYDTDHSIKYNKSIYSLDLSSDIQNILSYGWSEFPSYDYIEFLINNNLESIRYDVQHLHQNYDLSFSQWCEGVEFISMNQQHLDNPGIIFILNVPEWLHKPLDKNILHYTNLDDFYYLVNELAIQFNIGYLNKEDILNIIELISSNKISALNQFIESIESLTIDYSLFSYLLPVIMDRSKKRVREVKYRKLNSPPYWCDDHVWKLFVESNVQRGAEIVHQIASELVKQYSPSTFFYVCMARDAVPLYNLLFSMNYDSMLGVFSRSQIGDDDSVELLKNEIAIAAELTGKLPLLVDIQGGGTIYDYLREQGLDCEMVFGVSSNPDNCRYPLLINDINSGYSAIKYVEKLPQPNGRGEGVYQRSRCGGNFQDTLIAWGTRDPNAIGEELEDWEILQFRGLFMETMGVSHAHAGMIGNDNQQRLWGVRKNKVMFGIGIKIRSTYLETIQMSRFKTQHEVLDSSGMYNPEDRLRDEQSQFGITGIRTVFGIVEEDKYQGFQYGNNFCKLSNELTPYITLTPEDSLWSKHDHYPLSMTSELPHKKGNYRLTKQALVDNLYKRHILLYRLFLNGYITNPLLIKYLTRFNRQVNWNADYSYLLKWESRLSRIEDQV
jgi:hypothetical protein